MPDQDAQRISARIAADGKSYDRFIGGKLLVLRRTLEHWLVDRGNAVFGRTPRDNLLPANARFAEISLGPALLPPSRRIGPRALARRSDKEQAQYREALNSAEAACAHAAIVSGARQTHQSRRATSS